MNKKILVLLSLLLVIPGCANGSGGGGGKKGKQTPYRIVAGDETQKSSIVSRNGVPMAILATEFRSDLFLLADNAKPSDLEDYFALAKESGFNCVDLPIMWKEIEPEKDIYIYDDLKTYLDFAKQYELKLNLIWYGSFVDGQTHTANIPDYVVNDRENYPIIQYCYASSVFGDCVIMDWNNEKLLSREATAVTNALNYVAEWNLANEKYDPVIMLQCGQGLDRLQRYRINQYEIRIDGDLMSEELAKEFVNSYADTIGKAAKKSNYIPLTRVEFCEQQAVTKYVTNVFDLDSIDLVTTTYLYNVLEVKKAIQNYANKFGEEIPILDTENWAYDTNYRSELVTFAMGGCGFTTFNLSSPIYYPLEGNSKNPNDAKCGAIYRRKNDKGSTLSAKFEQINTRGDDIKKANNLISTGYIPCAKATSGNFALFGFNPACKSNSGIKQNIYLDCGILLDYTCSDANAISYAAYSSNFLYVMSSSDCEININNCFTQIGSTGTFDQDGFWVKDEDVEVSENQPIEIEADTLYRIRIGSIQELPESSILTLLGYKSTSNSIKE